MPVVEALDRRLLLDSSYPAGNTVSMITLKHTPGVTHDVDVYLDSQSTAATTLTPDPSDNSIEIIGNHTTFTLIDQVQTQFKPTGGVKFHVINHTDGILEIDAGENDKLVQTTASTSSSTTVLITDATHSASDTMGLGVDNLYILTNQTHTMGSGEGTTVIVPKFSPAHHLTIDAGAETYDQIQLGGDSDDTQVLNVDIKTGAGHDAVVLLDDDDNDGITTANIDFGGSGLGLDNTLDVWAGAVATLVKYPGTADHRLYVDNIHLHIGATSEAHPNARGGTLIVADDADIGTLRVEDQSEADIEAPANIGTFLVDVGGLADITAESDVPIFAVSGTAIVEQSITVDETLYADGYVEFTGTSGTSTVHQFAVENGSVEFSTGQVVVDLSADVIVQTASEVPRCTVEGVIEFQAGSSTVKAFDISATAPHSSTGVVQVDSSSHVTILLTSRMGTLHDEGIVTLRDRGGDWSTTAPRVLAIGILNLGSGPAGQLDIGDNDMVIDYASTTSIGTIVGYIAHGRNGGSWDGTGIIAAPAQGNGNLYEIGIAEATDKLGITGTQTATFAGATVDGTSVLLKFTYGGDANLDGKINVDDYGRIDFYVGLSGTSGWYNGDFNYDGKINVDDYGIIDFNVGIQDGTIL